MGTVDVHLTLLPYRCPPSPVPSLPNAPLSICAVRLESVHQIKRRTAPAPGALHPEGVISLAMQGFHLKTENPKPSSSDRK
ncbi:hypothetical protein U9M48_037825 [Paspalum notatum var. saurae]|uniref:Uncharacterized protein n=1 Tax=Paspalum notatum var. saurae TaxID=547442 RepID=A0AAQ3XB34_PASNO